MNNTPLGRAIVLAGNGIPVFPCLENKKPACKNGYKDATTDLDKVYKLFNQPGAVLIGVPTGEITGFDVLDIDPQNGGDDWLAIHKNHLPCTQTNQTRSGGVHMLFNHHKGLRNSVSKIAPGIDVRADGGYIIWWPATDLNVDNWMIVADWPAWIIEELSGLKNPPNFPTPSDPKGREVIGSVYASAALRSACSKIATAPEGTRNDTLNREAWSILRFVINDELPLKRVVESLAVAAMYSGLTPREVQATLYSTFRAKGVTWVI